MEKVEEIQNNIEEQKIEENIENKKEELNKTSGSSEIEKQKDNNSVSSKIQPKILNTIIPVSSNNQVLIDFCPNIDGIQSIFPADMVFSKKLNKCLTYEEEEALNKINQKEKDQEEKENLCIDKQSKIIDYKKELITLNNSYQKAMKDEAKRINENSTGALRGGVTNLTSNINNEYSQKEDEIYLQISLIQSEIQLYCNN